MEDSVHWGPKRWRYSPEIRNALVNYVIDDPLFGISAVMRSQMASQTQIDDEGLPTHSEA